MCAQKRTQSPRLGMAKPFQRQASGLERASIALGLTLKFADGIESKHKGMLETVNMLRKRRGEACAAKNFSLPAR